MKFFLLSTIEAIFWVYEKCSLRTHKYKEHFCRHVYFFDGIFFVCLFICAIIAIIIANYWCHQLSHLPSDNLISSNTQTFSFIAAPFYCWHSLHLHRNCTFCTILSIFSWPAYAKYVYYFSYFPLYIPQLQSASFHVCSFHTFCYTSFISFLLPVLVACLQTHLPACFSLSVCLSVLFCVLSMSVGIAWFNFYILLFFGTFISRYNLLLVWTAIRNFSVS